VFFYACNKVIPVYSIKNPNQVIAVLNFLLQSHITYQQSYSLTQPHQNQSVISQCYSLNLLSDELSQLEPAINSQIGIHAHIVTSAVFTGTL